MCKNFLGVMDKIVANLHITPLFLIDQPLLLPSFQEQKTQGVLAVLFFLKR